MATSTAAAVLVLAGCATTQDAPVSTLASADRRAPVQVAGTTLDGQRLAFADLRGSVVVVNFWASWCIVCRDEAGTLERTATELREQGVRFVGVAIRDTRANADGFLRTLPTTYPSLLDDPTTNAVVLAFRTPLPVAPPPTTYVLDREGRVAARVIGRVDEAQLRALVEAVRTGG